MDAHSLTSLDWILDGRRDQVQPELALAATGIWCWSNIHCDDGHYEHEESVHDHKVWNDREHEGPSPIDDQTRVVLCWQVEGKGSSKN